MHDVFYTNYNRWSNNKKRELCVCRWNARSGNITNIKICNKLVFRLLVVFDRQRSNSYLIKKDVIIFICVYFVVFLIKILIGDKVFITGRHGGNTETNEIQLFERHYDDQLTNGDFKRYTIILYLTTKLYLLSVLIRILDYFWIKKIINTNKTQTPILIIQISTLTYVENMLKNTENQTVKTVFFFFFMFSPPTLSTNKNFQISYLFTN